MMRTDLASAWCRLMPFRVRGELVNAQIWIVLRHGGVGLILF